MTVFPLTPNRARYQRSVLFPIRTRYFKQWIASFLTRISHPSGSRLGRQTIRRRPWSIRTPEIRRYHAGATGYVTDHVVLYQPLVGYRHRRIKKETESGCCRLQSDQMDSHQTPDRFTTAPKSIIETVWIHHKAPDLA